MFVSERGIGMSSLELRGEGEIRVRMQELGLLDGKV